MFKIKTAPEAYVHVYVSLSLYIASWFIDILSIKVCQIGHIFLEEHHHKFYFYLIKLIID